MSLNHKRERKMLNMKKSDQLLYIAIRAEQIKYHQDKENGHLFNKPYSLETANEIARVQLENDLSKNKLRISLEQLLTLSNDECIAIIEGNIIETGREFTRDQDLTDLLASAQIKRK